LYILPSLTSLTLEGHALSELSPGIEARRIPGTAGPGMPPHSGQHSKTHPLPVARRETLVQMRSGCTLQLAPDCFETLKQPPWHREVATDGRAFSTSEESYLLGSVIGPGTDRESADCLGWVVSCACGGGLLGTDLCCKPECRDGFQALPAWPKSARTRPNVAYMSEHVRTLVEGLLASCIASVITN